MTRPLDKVEPLAALAAFNAAFAEVAKELVEWTVAALDQPVPEPGRVQNRRGNAASYSRLLK